MTRTAAALRATLDLVPADVLSYRRGPGAWDGPGWYVRPFGGSERKLHGAAVDIIRAART